MMNNKERIYIIGFPKSGNTWLSRLVAEAYNSNIYVPDPSDAINCADNSSDRTGKYIIHKIHSINSVNTLNDIEGTKKIYIVRDPRAVFVSGFFHLYRRLSKEKVKNNFFFKMFFFFEVSNLNANWNKSFFRIKEVIKICIYNIFPILFKPSGKYHPPTQTKIKHVSKLAPPVIVGDWSSHVNFWTSINGIILVKYEDLLLNTEEELSKLLSFLDLNISNQRIKEIIENQSFINKKRKFIEDGNKENAKFLRSGKKDDWKDLLDEKRIKIIESKHKETMKWFNYIE